MLTLREQLVLAALTGAAVDVRRRAWPTMALDEAANIARCAVVADAALEALASQDPPAIQPRPLPAPTPMAAAAAEGEEYGTGGEYGDGSYGDCPANTEAPAGGIYGRQRQT